MVEKYPPRRSDLLAQVARVCLVDSLYCFKPYQRNTYFCVGKLSGLTRILNLSVCSNEIHRAVQNVIVS
jgi:hypothetical protein